MFTRSKRLARVLALAIFLLMLTSCNLPEEIFSEGGADLNPPEGAWIDAPLNGAEAPPGISIKVIGHVDPEVGQAVLYINGASSGLPAAPILGKKPPAYEWLWNPEQAGVYYLRVGGADGPLSSPVQVTISGEMTFGAQFWADQTSLRLGECTATHWTTENASLVQLDGVEVAGVGDQGVCPQQDEEHILHVEYKDQHTEDLSVKLLLIIDTPTYTPTIYVPPVIITTAPPPPVIVTTAPPPPPQDNQPPPAPSGLSPCGSQRNPAYPPSCTGVVLSWNAVKDSSGIAQYQITLVDAYSQQTTQYYSTGPSYTLGSVDSKYSWYVKAQDGAGNWGPASQACHFMCVIVK
jgi:hypothetical protein